MNESVSYEWKNTCDAMGYVRENINEQADLADKYLVALYNGGIIGLIGVKMKTHYIAELRHLHVLKEYRSKGIGKDLLERADRYTLEPIKVATIRVSNLLNFFNNLKRGWKLAGVQPSPYSKNNLFIMYKTTEVTDYE